MKRLTLLFLLPFLLSATYTAVAQVGSFQVSAPDSVAGDYDYIAVNSETWGVRALGVCGDVVLMQDSAGANLGCTPNVANLTGKIALVFRGTCGFTAKALAAQNAGAIGILIANSATGTIPGAIGPGPEAPLITIPTAMISNANGIKLRGVLATGATVTGCMTLVDVPVTFLVDLGNDTISPAGVYVGYTVEGEDPQASLMTSLGGGLFTDTIYVPATSKIGYVFVNGATQADIEVVPDCGATTVGDSTGYVRYIYAGTTGKDAEKVCFGQCTRCQTVVTFRVDMRQMTIPATGAHIAGNFQGYNPGSTPLVNIGDSIYIYSLTATPGDTLLYKFINGNTFNEDERAITAECGAPNGFGGFNRIFVVPDEDEVVLLTVCFDSCGACPAPLPSFCDSAAIICDGFDSYTLGGLNAQSADWDVWDGTGGDGIVTDEEAESGSQSMKIDFALPGAQQDVLLLLGDSISGNYLLEWKMFIPAGKLAYYNIQHDLTPHVYGSEVFFEANGEGRISVGTVASQATFTFEYDKWISVKQYIDIDNDVTYLLVDSSLAGPWKFSTTSGTGAPPISHQLAGVDFFPVDAAHKYYVDNVQFIQLGEGAEYDFCFSAKNIDSLFNGAVNSVISSELYDNTNATTVGDPETGFECFLEPSGQVSTAMPSLENSLWFTFTGDGGLYFIETGDCGSTNYINDGDTQIAIYSGTSCSNLTPVLCNEDGPNATSALYPAGDTLKTVNGTKYYVLVDGFNFQGSISDGEFCIKVKELLSVGTKDPAFDQAIRLAPNPTNGVTNLMVSLPEATDLTIRVTNSLGQQVMQRIESNVQESTLRLDMSRFAKGLYFVELSDGTHRSTRRLVVE